MNILSLQSYSEWTPMTTVHVALFEGLEPRGSRSGASNDSQCRAACRGGGPADRP